MTHPFLGRVVGAIAAWLTTAMLGMLTSVFGIELSVEAAEQLSGVVKLLVENASTLIFIIFYGFYHKLLNKRLNPSDVALTDSPRRTL